MSKQNRTQNRTQNRSQRAAAELELDRRRARNRQVLTVGGVLLVLVLVAGGLFFLQQSNDPTGDVTATPAGADDYSLPQGDPDAPHTVVIYEDFLCPFCGELEAASREDLGRLTDEGQVYVEYRPIDFLSRFGDYSERATNAVAAVLDQEGPEAAKELHDALYENQPSESGPFPDDDTLVQRAVAAGADEEQVRPAIEDLEFEAWVANATDQANRDGIQATPTILLDGEPFTDGGTVDELASNLVARIEE